MEVVEVLRNPAANGGFGMTIIYRGLSTRELDRLKHTESAAFGHILHTYMRTYLVAIVKRVNQMVLYY